MSKTTKPKKKEFLKNFIIGGTSASLGKSLVAPIERIKLILQTQNANIKILNSKKTKIYSGTINTIFRVFREEGIISFWRGNLINLMRYIPTQAFNFAFKDFYKNYFKKKIKNGFFSNILSGGTAGVTSSFIVYPMDFLRTRLAVDMGREKSKREFINLKDCIKKIYKKNKIKGFYKGLFLTLPTVFIYRSFYFGLFDTFKQKKFFFENTNRKFFLAFCVTSISGLVVYPLDTIRRSMMMQSGKSKGEIQYFTYFNCSKDIFRRESFLGFYRGAVSNVFRGLGGSFILVINDEIRDKVK